MLEKQRGTADVTLRAWLLGDDDGGAGAQRVLQRFGQGARLRGTLVVTEQAWEWIPDPNTPELDPPVLRLTLRYRHTCKNRGNHESDARRFFTNALAAGSANEWAGNVIDVTLNSWEPS